MKMRAFYALVKREVSAYFLSPMAYIFLFSFLVMQGFHFSLLTQFFTARARTQSTGDLFADFMWGLTFFYLLVIIPCITMRLLSEERRSGTFEVLMTAPVTDLMVVLAKYVGALLFYASMWATTGVYLVLLAVYATPDWGQVASAYLGVLLFGAMLLAVGILCSALTQNQIASAILAIAINFSLWLASYLKEFPWATPEHALSETLKFSLKDVLSRLDFIQMGMDFTRGSIDSRNVVLYASLTALFLFSAVKATESRRWR